LYNTAQGQLLFYAARDC